MRKLFTLLFISTALVFNACKKGNDGEQGEKGEQGIAGADGSSLLSGNGVPAISLGKNGDYYLDKIAVAIYGPKTAIGWGSPTTFKGDIGATGAAGTAGSKILSGTDAPSVSLGAIGDFYFDTQNIAIYGPKMDNGWGNPVSLKSSDNGIRTFIYSNQKVSPVVFNPNDGYGIYEGKLEILPLVNYQNYYDEGLVLVFLRNENYENGEWLDEDRGLGNSAYTINVGVASKKNKIVIEGMTSNNSYNGDDLRNYQFDIKVLLVPSGSVTRLASVNTKDFKAVELALGL